MVAKHEPTPELKAYVEELSLAGAPQSIIAELVGISDKTLRLHYRDVLDEAIWKKTAKIAGTLYEKAAQGDLGAQIFWLKTRGKWSEKSALEVTGDLNISAIKRVIVDGEKRITPKKQRS